MYKRKFKISLPMKTLRKKETLSPLYSFCYKLLNDVARKKKRKFKTIIYEKIYIVAKGGTAFGHILFPTVLSTFNAFPQKPWLLRVCSTSL